MQCPTGCRNYRQKRYSDPIYIMLFRSSHIYLVTLS